MLHTHFYNLSRIKSAHTRLMIASGTEDNLTPAWMAEGIFAAAHRPKHAPEIPPAAARSGQTTSRVEALAGLFATPDRAASAACESALSGSFRIEDRLHSDPVIEKLNVWLRAAVAAQRSAFGPWCSQKLAAPAG
jgi:fermentation-respiration switch protein FrsA (DUF1100 family)